MPLQVFQDASLLTLIEDKPNNGHAAVLLCACRNVIFTTNKY